MIRPIERRDAADAARPAGFRELSVRAFSDGCDTAPVPHVEGWFVEEPARNRGIGLAHGRLGFEEVDRLIKFRKRL